MKILALSDKVEEHIYSLEVVRTYPDIDLVIGCGDLPYYYLEFVLDALDLPVFFVRGNHAKIVEYGEDRERREPQGAIDLHQKVIWHNGLLFAGFEGSLRYRPGPFQYTQAEMWWMVLKTLPRLMWNKLRRGRYLDVLVTHAPPWQIHDRDDLPHQGFRALRWMIEVFQPKYHFHGHIHIYDINDPHVTLFGKTKVVNAFGHRTMELEGLQGDNNRGK